MKFEYTCITYAIESERKSVRCNLFFISTGNENHAKEVKQPSNWCNGRIISFSRRCEMRFERKTEDSRTPVEIMRESCQDDLSTVKHSWRVKTRVTRSKADL